MSIINVHEARTHLSRILERVARGEEIIIARNGQPVARLVPISDKPREPGRCKGKIRIKRSFDEPLPEGVMRAFAGKGE